MLLREWTHSDAPSRSHLPPDLTNGDCPAVHPRGYFCTRQAEHTGRHAAGGGFFIVAVWEPVAEPCS